MIPLPSLSPQLAPLAQALNQSSSDARVHWMRGLSRKEMLAVWKLSEGNPLSLDHFHGVPDEIIIHEGKNSLPAFTLFQKRFVLREGKVQGYNEGSTRWLVGPGHFTMFQSGQESVVDYVNHPTSVPSEFPALARNDSGISTLVYGGTEDWCRRVSQHVIIGQARRAGKPIGAYFMLTRT